MTPKVPESPLELSRAHLMHARRNMLAGDPKSAERDLKSSRIYAEMHAKKLSAQGKHDEAKEQLEQHQHLTEYVKAMRPVIKADSQESDLQKRFAGLPQSSRGEPIGHAYMTSGKIKETMSVSRPGQDPRYHYKQIHELNHEDQVKAHHQYGSKSMDHFSYPIDKETGQLVVARRAPLQPHEIPKSLAQQFNKPKVEHREGASVRVNSPGSPFHGKLGIVRNPHPVMPDKIPVQIGPKEHQTIYISHAEVKPSQPMSKIEKALVSYLNVQKALKKIK